MQMRQAGGFTLIEVLVALLVLAIGVVGASGAHITAMRTRHQSALMSEAVQLGTTLSERMGANSAAMRRADNANPYAQLDYTAGGGAPQTPGGGCHGSARCDSGELAQFDLYDIKQALHARFPGGRVLVCRDGAPWDDGRAALTWSCVGAAGAPLVIKLGWQAKNADGSEALDRAQQAAPSVAVVVARMLP